MAETFNVPLVSVEDDRERVVPIEATTFEEAVEIALLRDDAEGWVPKQSAVGRARSD